MRKSFTLSLSLFLITGCSPEPITTQTAEIPVAGAINTKSESTDDQASDTESDSAGPRIATIDGVRFTIPAGWKKAELTQAQAGFISARYLIPVEGEELQLTISTARGGIDANFDRWIGQFQLQPGTEPLRDTIDLIGGKAFWIDLRGTYTASTGFTGSDPEAGTRMLGVGIPLSDGEMYLKLLGPTEQVGKVVDPLRDVVKSASLP